MSNNHHLGVEPPSGDIQHVQQMSEHIGALYLNDEYSDVTLVVDGHHFRGHKVILAARSEYFRALLFGGMRESQQDEIELKGTTLDPFKVLLKYIYTGHMSLSTQKEEVILDVLGLAHQYGFVELENAISSYLKAILSIRNVCVIFDVATLYQQDSLISMCQSFMDKHALEVIHHESFLGLSASALTEMIGRDSFCAQEVDIFRGVREWVESNPGENPKGILSKVRLELMSVKELLTVVRPTKLLPPDNILDAIQARTENRDIDLGYRGYLMPDENVASPSHGACVPQGDRGSTLLDGDISSYDMEHGFTRHPIDENNHAAGIVIKLGNQCIINHMKMLLWDRDMRAYSYCVYVSMDQHDWVKVVDHTNYPCRSWQYLYFPKRVVRYIKIVGTYNTVNRVFHLVAFEAMYTEKEFELEWGIVVPKENVASISMSACVPEGVSRNRNALLNGDTSNYDWDSGYTCHQLGSGAIVVQLSQPYVIESMRLLLWDCDDRSYRYYIEVSSNQRDWDLVADRTREACQSWQTIHFERRPIIFIRIVGTHNTANEVFHCVHFECPAQIKEDKENETLIPKVPRVEQSCRLRTPSPVLPSAESRTDDVDSD